MSGEIKFVLKFVVVYFALLGTVLIIAEKSDIPFHSCQTEVSDKR